MFCEEVEIGRTVLGIIEGLVNLVRVFSFEWHAWDCLVIDVESFTFDLDRVAGNSDHALNKINALIFWILEDDDVPTFRSIA